MKAAIYSQKNDLDTFLYLSKFVHELEKKGVQAILYEEMAHQMQFSKTFETFAAKQDLEEKKVEKKEEIFDENVAAEHVIRSQTPRRPENQKNLDTPSGLPRIRKMTRTLNEPFIIIIYFCGCVRFIIYFLKVLKYLRKRLLL